MLMAEPCHHNDNVLPIGWQSCANTMAKLFTYGARKQKPPYSHEQSGCLPSKRLGIQRY